MILPLFCKPGAPGLICKSTFNEIPLHFESMDTGRHLTELHRWVNLPYAQHFLNMTGSLGIFQACYQCILQNPFAHSFVGFQGEKLSCQLDIYRVAVDELAEHITCDLNDTGFHLIMAPIDKHDLPVRGLTPAFLRLFINWYFSFPQAHNLWAEPDVDNGRSIRLLRLLGFTYIKTVQMSYKKAHVYKLSRLNHTDLPK
jgi:hypothetical protein